MRSLPKTPGVRIISIFIILVIMINISFADDLYPRSSEEKRYEKQSKWSFSFYLATVFGGPGDKIKDQMRISGFHNPGISFSSSSKYSFLSRFRPQSWMIQLNYRMTKPLGLGILYSNSLLKETVVPADALASLEGTIGPRNSVKTISILLSIYLNEHIILAMGPSYNMTDSPSNKNRMGFLAHLNIRVPLSNSFSISGICQYRHIAGTTIGPYTLENSDDILKPTISTNTKIFPPTEISYSHIFIGIGVGINFMRK